MTYSVFIEVRFWLLVLFSLILPFGIYWTLLVKRAISPFSVLLFGFGLVIIAGIDIYLLRTLSTEAKLNHSLAADQLFNSELSVALYLLPAMAAGIGINLVSHILIRHLTDAEQRFEQEHQRH